VEGGVLLLVPCCGFELSLVFPAEGVMVMVGLALVDMGSKKLNQIQLLISADNRRV